MQIQTAPLREIAPETLYAILRLRADVFVVEQDCVYPDLDGRDLEPATLLMWVEGDGVVTASLRLMLEPDGGARIGRVVTAATHRGSGQASALMRAAVGQAAPRTIRLSAQSHLQQWYEQFGFAQDGEEFLEDGIPHIPMLRR